MLKNTILMFVGGGEVSLVVVAHWTVSSCAIIACHLIILIAVLVPMSRLGLGTCLSESDLKLSHPSIPSAKDFFEKKKKLIIAQ